MEEQRPVPGQVQIKADEKDLQGQYSNLVMLHHNLEEFTLNFIYIFPNGPQGKLLSSVIVSPGHAKRILAGAGREYLALRGTVRANQGSPGGQRANRRMWVSCSKPNRANGKSQSLELRNLAHRKPCRAASCASAEAC